MTTLFPSADCNVDSIAYVASCPSMRTGKYVSPGRVGFHLIDSSLVPYSFVDEVEHQIQMTGDRLNCFKVSSVTDLFSDTYLTSLTLLEMKVLGGCVLLLIEEGAVPFSLIDERKAATGGAESQGDRHQALRAD